jgi:hypothetical protein
VPHSPGFCHLGRDTLALDEQQKHKLRLLLVDASEQASAFRDAGGT